jgi:hypothetical protein
MLTIETKREKLIRRGGPTNASNSRKGRPAFRPMKQSRAEFPQDDLALLRRTTRKDAALLTFD